MSLAKSQVFSNETLAHGVDHLNQQQMKCEKTPDRQEMEKELQERGLQFKHCFIDPLLEKCHLILGTPLRMKTISQQQMCLSGHELYFLL